MNCRESSQGGTIYQQSLDVTYRVWGEKHPGRQTSFSTSARFYNTTGNYAMAEPCLQLCLKIRLELSADMTPTPSLAFQAWRCLHFDARLMGGAEAAVPQSLAMNREIFGDTHEATTISLNDLAEIYCHMEDHPGHSYRFCSRAW